MERKNSTFVIILGITVALVLIGSSTIVSFGSFVGSPNYQLESGVAPEDITCRDNLVLVLRTNGDVACVTETTFKKLGWNVVKINFATKTSTEYTLDGISLSAYSLSLDPLMRSPPPSQVLKNSATIFDFTVSDSSIPQNALTQTAINIDPTQWLPTYIPSGQELKYLSYSETDERFEIIAFYGPNNIQMDSTFTGRQIYDNHGILLWVYDSNKSVESIENSLDNTATFRNGTTVELFDATAIIIDGDPTQGWLSSITTHNGEIMINITTARYNATELIKILESLQ